MTWRDYKEGDVFIIPESKSRFHLGLIARKQGRGLLGYFFTPLPNDEVAAEHLRLDKNQAVFIRKFSGLGFEDGAWKLLGKLPGFSKADWPVPAFANRDPIMEVPRAFLYDDKLNYLGFKRIDEEAFELLPKDGLSGWKALEGWLKEL